MKFFLDNQNLPCKSNKYIGKYFQDHLGLFIGDVKIINKKNFFLLFNNGYLKNSLYQPKLKFIYRDNLNNLGISAEFKFYSKYYSNLEKFKTSLKNLINDFSILSVYQLFKRIIKLRLISFSLLYHYLFYKKIKSYSDLGIKLYLQSEQIPLYESKIKKIKKNNYSVNWKISGDEIKAMKYFVKEVKLFLLSNNLAKVDSDNFYELSNSKILKNIRDTNHPCGGLIISKTSNSGVVDKNCKVWKTSNVYVAGSSIFPKSSFANSTFTSLAFALKLADKLKKNV